LARQYSPATTLCKYALPRELAVVIANVLPITQHVSTKHKLMGRDKRHLSAVLERCADPKGMYQMLAAAQQL